MTESFASENGTRKKRVAIGCQGGGVHTAFTAGALKRLLRDERYEVVALSGASGGAICAFFAWYALLEEDNERAAALAAELLDAYWRDNAARAPLSKYLNDLTVWMSRVEGATALVEVSPYDTSISTRIRSQLKQTLEKQPVDFENLDARVGPSSPVLLVSAIDVVVGSAKAFDSRDGEISLDALLASSAVPPVFRAEHVDGGVYWDALFCQNPPIREFGRLKPDEIWVIKTLPDSSGEEPKSVADIMDRRNELSGNVALYKDLYILEKINELVASLGEGETEEDKRLRLPDAREEYRHIEVRMIALPEDLSQSLDFATKIDRSPALIQRLMARGESVAGEFLKAL